MHLLAALALFAFAASRASGRGSLAETLPTADGGRFPIYSENSRGRKPRDPHRPRGGYRSGEARDGKCALTVEAPGLLLSPVQVVTFATWEARLDRVLTPARLTGDVVLMVSRHGPPPTSA